MKLALIAFCLVVGLRAPIQAEYSSEAPKEGTYYPQGFGGPALPISPLSAAIGRNDVAEVQKLLDHGADPNQKMPDGTAPLHQAIYREDLRICRLLLEHGADPNVVIEPASGRYSNKWTPIFFAVHLQKPNFVQELLKHGAKADLRDATGKSLLQLALQTHNTEIITLIKSHLTRS